VAIARLSLHSALPIYPEVDVLAVRQFEGGPGGHRLAVAAEAFGAGHQRCPSDGGLVVVFSIHLVSATWSGVNRTRRCTKMPGRWMSSGASSPASTTCSASTMQVLPAIAATGEKLRAVRWTLRFPLVSATAARTSE